MSVAAFCGDSLETAHGAASDEAGAMDAQKMFADFFFEQIFALSGFNGDVFQLRAQVNDVGERHEQDFAALRYA